MTVSRLLTGAVAIVGFAALAPGAFAVERPDDRAGPLGVGSVTAQPDVLIAYGTADTVEARINAGLDARSGLRVVVRPDDRAGMIGVGSVPVVAEPVRPDDRGGPIGVGAAEIPFAVRDGVPTATAEPPVAVPATGQPGDTPLIDWTTSWTIALIAALLAAIVGFIAAYRVDHRPTGPRMTRGPGGRAVTH